MKNHTPILWDDRTFSFVPTEAFSNAPCYSEDECTQVCNELNRIVKLCTYKPKAGDIYYYPVTYIHSKGGFIMMDNQAAFNECPYPACADPESCQKVCDMLNRVLEDNRFVPVI